MSDTDTPSGMMKYVRDEDGGLSPLAVVASTMTGAIVANTIHLSIGLLTYMGTIGPMDIASMIVGGIGAAIVGGAALFANYLYTPETDDNQ